MARGSIGSTLVAAAALAAAVTPAAAARFSIGTATGIPGDPVQVVVTLDSEGRVAEFEHALTLPDGFFVTQSTVERGGCRRLNLNYSQLISDAPEGCARGVDCEGVRATGRFRSVAADGEHPLYQCEVVIPAGTPPGTYAVVGAGRTTATSGGALEPAASADGAIEVIDGATLVVGSISGAGGAQTSLGVRLSSTVPVAGFAHALVLPEDVSVLSDGEGSPRCTLAPELAAECASFAFAPAGCAPGSSCTGVRAALAVPCTTAAIADETLVYACDVVISAATSGAVLPIEAVDASASDPAGAPVPLLVRDGLLSTDPSVITVNADLAGVFPGQSGTFRVYLTTNQDIAALTHEVGFDPQTPIADDGAGRPRCTTLVPGREALIRFLPQGCTPGSDCTAISVLLPALGLEPLPRFAILYACEVTAAADVPLGTYPLRVRAITASGPSGNVLPDPVGDDGGVGVFDEFPTLIAVGSAQGSRGERVRFTVGLETEVEVSGTQNDLAFEPETRIAASPNGRPLCRDLTGSRLDGVAFAFRPPGCAPPEACTGLRALILSLSNVDPIPDGSPLYECDVDIAPDAAAGTYPLRISAVGASNPSGEALFTGGRDGTIVVTGAAPTPTDTPAQSTPGSTATTAPTATATRPAATPTGGPLPAGADDDGCTLAPGSAGGAWPLLACGALLVLRGRGARRAPSRR